MTPIRFSQHLSRTLLLPIVLGCLLGSALPAIAQTLEQLFQQGNAAQNAGNYEEAERIWQQVIDQDSDNAEAYFELGLTFYYLGQLDEAIAHYQRAIDLDPNYALAYNNLGIALRQQGNLEEAIAHYQRAIDLDPNYAAAYSNLGLALSDQGNLDEAIAHYQRAIEIEPNAIRYNNLGLALQQQGNLEAAIVEYERSLALDPDFAVAYSNLQEAERLLARQIDPPPAQITELLPSDEPLLPQLRSTVRLVVETSQGREFGTGWVVERQEQQVWIVTNRHVIMDGETRRSDSIEVELFSNLPPERRLRFPAEVVYATEPEDDLDLAVLRVEGLPEDIQPLSFSTDSIGRDSDVRIIGHPSMDASPWSTLRGQVSAIDPDRIQLTAAISPGVSGGPVFNMDYEVIGLVFGSSDPTTTVGATQGFGFAYPIGVVLQQLQEWGVR